MRRSHVPARPYPFESPNVIADVGPIDEPGIREVHQIPVDRSAIEIDFQARGDVTVRLGGLRLDEMPEDRQPRRRGTKPC